MNQRIDQYPTEAIGGYNVRQGSPIPFGVSHVPNGLNFSVYTSAGTSCTLVLFHSSQEAPFVEIQIPDYFRIGNVYCIIVFGLDVEDLEYGYRIEGPFAPELGDRFDATKVLLDPYARVISGRNQWGHHPNWEQIYPYRARVSLDDFDWGTTRPLEIPPQDLIIYEAHVRGLTQSETSEVKYRGTYAGVVEKIPYLKSLGINAIELMPVSEFDEFENARVNPETGEQLYNYWGYSTIGFFAPKAAYAATGNSMMQVDEFKRMVKCLHEAGIEVILDVVFNHTAEGNECGPTLSFKGLDNKVYYMLTPQGYYFNFSGTGNTLNCNNPVVRSLVLDCLRYWAAEYKIDGFRFDLASILGRDPWGFPLSNPPLLEALAFDPILSSCKLIAEAWDAGGLYQVGSFPAFGRWSEWNGRYRDCIRRFLKGDEAQVGELAQRIQGSPDLYRSSGRLPSTSINFITCHDGFTLADLVSYNYKHNSANGEGGRDGCDNNYSWNCGEEGTTRSLEILALRLRQMMNAFAILLTSRGTPMILMGDEFGRTQFGNNNAYCIDSPLTWVDWSLLSSAHDLFAFVSALIEFRHRHPCLRTNSFEDEGSARLALPSCSFHGTEPWKPDWSDESRQLAWMFCRDEDESCQNPDIIYVIANAAHYATTFMMPNLLPELEWAVVFNTGTQDQPSYSIPQFLASSAVLAGERSVIILQAFPSRHD